MIGSGHVTGAAFYEQHLPWARALVSVANSPIACSLRLRRQMTVLCKAALSHIAACQLILVRGEPPNSTYMFKHALVRDAAYATMVRSKRQQLHSRIADVLMMEFRNTVETQPELMAYHLAQAGLTEKAIAHLRKAQPGPRQESRPSSAGGAMDEVAFERKVAEAHVSADLRL